MAHNLNPFDFVPFAATKPITNTIEQWQHEGSKLLTGWIQAQIKALTPIHIVGKQDATDAELVPGRGLEARKKSFKILKSSFYRRHGKAFIPAPSIRGMLRAFIEAACNGWVSQVTPYYLQKKDERQIGFQSVDASEELANKGELNKIDSDIQRAFSLPDGFYMPRKLTTGQKSNLPVDLASFLFGYIPSEGDAWHGRVSIEDAEIDSALLSFNDLYRVPDIQAEAFMGGGKPSASSWWYQRPYKIRLRREVVDFVGIGYRGRKFYYHQDPERCVEWYFDPRNWPNDNSRPIYSVPLECLPTGGVTKPFYIHFEDLPEPLLRVLLFALSPGKRLRHKLGYGKAYGYGSIEVQLLGASLRGTGYAAQKTNYDPQSVLQEAHEALWHKEKLDGLGVGGYLEWTTFEDLARILWFAKDSTLLFTYPRFNSGHQVTDLSLQSLRANGLQDPVLKALGVLINRPICTDKDLFDELWKQGKIRMEKHDKKLIRQYTLCVPGGFLPAVSRNELLKVLEGNQRSEIAAKNFLTITNEKQARQVASELAARNLRTALHFEVYRENATGYSTLQKRRLDVAETKEGDTL